MASDFLFVPLGGVGEIGMNFAMYGYGPPDNRQWIVVDCGIGFGDPARLPGVDVVVPDISFAIEERRNILGIVLTHAHEDHYGALPQLWSQLEVPVYATPFTAGMLTAKVAGERGIDPIPVEEVELGGSITLGPFEIEFITVAHSIPEPNALAIRTPAGLVVHSGDWKLDPDPVIGAPTDSKRLGEIGEEGCLALVCDSTNAMREGLSPSEGDVAKALAEQVAQAKKRVAVTCFASNLARIRSIALAAAQADRSVVVVGRAMQRVITIGREQGYLDGVPQFHNDSHYGYLPREKVLLLCTGSQGEPRAALTRIAAGTHPSITFAPGDTLIYSARMIPGNERAVGGVFNGLVRDGVEIVTDADALVHVSGHPRRGELEQMFDWLKPKIVLPVHGEAMHMAANAALAQAHGVPQVVTGFNGDVIRFAPGKPGKVDEVRSGRVLRDGKMLISEADDSIKERRSLSYAGMVSIAFALDGQGEIDSDIDVELAGVPEQDGRGGDMVDLVLDTVEDAVASMPRAKRKSAEQVRETVRRAVRREIDNVWGKKTRVQVFAVEI